MTTTRIDTAAVNAQHDLRTIAAQHSTLHRESTRELSGPCPHCGGTDRLHVTADSFFCRACYPLGNGQPHDAIAYMRWLHGCSFPEALTMLGNPMPTTTRPTPPTPRTAGQTRPDADWFATQPDAMRRYQEALWADDNPARVYLTARGFTADTCIAFGLGYGADVHFRGPAVAIPWWRGPDLYAIHWRFLDSLKPKLKYESGSRPAGLLWGRHAFRDPAHTLILIEGELNAMSVYQVARSAGVDVLSLGGESTALTPAAVSFAKSYGTRIVWMDKQERAEHNARLVDGSAFWSEHDGQKTDANDHLQHLTLRPLLEGLFRRLSAAR